MSIISHNLHIQSCNAYIDPNKPVDKAIITHGHADHAIANHKSVLATEDTINIMKIRYGENCAGNFQIIKYGEKLSINGIQISFYPAGHILGRAQILIENNKEKITAKSTRKAVRRPLRAVERVRVLSDMFIDTSNVYIICI